MTTEAELKDYFISKIKNDFFIINECEGIYNSDGKNHNVRIDFLLKAKQHLIDIGFPDKYFGAEIKYIKNLDNPYIELNDLFAQCLVYRKSIFQNRGYEPFMIIAFTNINIINHEDFIFINEIRQIKCENHLKNIFCQNQLNFLSRFNIGIIDFSDNFKFGNFYEIILGQFKYFYRHGKYFKLTHFKNKSLGSYTGSKRKYNITS